MFQIPSTLLRNAPLAALLLAGSLQAATAAADTSATRGAPPGGRGMKPPAAAFAACKGKSIGSTCTATGPDGKSLSGTCVAPPGSSASDSVACMPAPPSGGQRPQ